MAKQRNWSGSNNLTLCNNCAGKIVRSLNEHYHRNGLDFCCEECADAFASPDNADPGAAYPTGLAYDLGCEEDE